jgi:hypothetical protein
VSSNEGDHLNYITIDGDDIGNKIAYCYFNNDAARLRELSLILGKVTADIAELLKTSGLDVLFCAADGVVAFGERNLDFGQIFEDLTSLAPPGITFSAGVGTSLSDAYVALLTAKSSGKAQLCFHNYTNTN